LNLPALADKMKNIEVHLNKIKTMNSAVHNFYDAQKDDMVYHKYYTDIKKMSEDITIKYTQLNQKVNSLVDVVKTRVDHEFLDDPNKLNISSKEQKVLEWKNKVDGERYNERKAELEKVSKVTNQILELSRNMNTEVQKQGETLAKIEDNVKDSTVNVADGKKQLLEKQAREQSTSSFYLWVCSVLSLVLLVLLVYIYFAYYRN